MIPARLLIVDDEPQIRRVLRASLVAEGYEVHAARTGEEAIERLRSERFDLVLLDMNMPGIGGLEACREMRSISEAAIIMLTIRNAEADKVASLDAGADDYVLKPFSTLELLARIRANLRRVSAAGDAAQQTLSFDEIEVNLASNHVRVRGVDIRLTRKEHQLLQYLVAHPNVTIPHTRLLQAVWGPDYGSEVEYLHVFMNQLRKKLEPDPANPRYIMTEPWQGYRFQLPEKTLL